MALNHRLAERTEFENFPCTSLQMPSRNAHKTQGIVQLLPTSVDLHFFPNDGSNLENCWRPTEIEHLQMLSGGQRMVQKWPNDGSSHTIPFRRNFTARRAGTCQMTVYRNLSQSNLIHSLNLDSAAAISSPPQSDRPCGFFFIWNSSPCHLFITPLQLPFPTVVQ